MVKSKTRAASPLTGLKQRYCVVLAIFATFSAVPLASNRPAWWLLWTLCLALAGALYYTRASFLAPKRDIRLIEYTWPFAIAAIVPLYAIFQTLNFGSLLPSFLTAMRPDMHELQPQSISMLPSASLIGALRFFGYLIFLALIIEVANRPKRILLILRLLFVGICLQALWAMIALRLLGDISIMGQKTVYLGAATGTFVNRNSLATFLGFGLILGATLIGELLQRDHGRVSRPMTVWEKLGGQGGLIAVGMLNILMALLATQSRLGTLASLIALIVVLFLLRWNANKLSLRFVVQAVVGAFVVVLGAVWLRAEEIRDRFLYLEGDSGTRLALYDQVWDMVTLRPLTGFGFDAFGPAFEAFRGPPLLGSSNFDLAHNSYLTLWSEMGLVVGSIPMLLLAYCAVKLLRSVRDGSNFPIAASAALGALVLGAIHSLGDFSLEMPANVYVFLAILGMGMAKRTQMVAIEDEVVVKVAPAKPTQHISLPLGGKAP